MKNKHSQKNNLTTLHLKGQSSVNVIIYLTLVTALIIIILWYATTIRPNKLEIERLQNDITQTKQHLANACLSNTYKATIVFASEPQITIQEQEICLKTPTINQCFPLQCPMKITQEGDTTNGQQIGREQITITKNLDGTGNRAGNTVESTNTEVIIS